MNLTGPWWLIVLIAVLVVLAILWMVGVRFNLDAELIRLLERG